MEKVLRALYLVDRYRLWIYGLWRPLTHVMQWIWFWLYDTMIGCVFHSFIFFSLCQFIQITLLTIAGVFVLWNVIELKNAT